MLILCFVLLRQYYATTNLFQKIRTNVVITCTMFGQKIIDNSFNFEFTSWSKENCVHNMLGEIISIRFCRCRYFVCKFASYITKVVIKMVTDFIWIRYFFSINLKCSGNFNFIIAFPNYGFQELSQFPSIIFKGDSSIRKVVLLLCSFNVI